ncbi:MAG TPA: cytochrome c oxidase subunit II, partial [Gemmatimonadaceae bacterium]
MSSLAVPVALPLALALAAVSCAGAPAIFGTHGLAADRIAVLGWVFTIISCVVLAVVTVLVIVALARRQAAPAGRPANAIEHSGHAVRWIVVGGIIVPAITLVASFLVTLVIQAEVSNPPRPPVATIEVTGHRWWWEVKYLGAGPNETVVTANEIHVPVGQPVRLELVSADVIHSFWVPQLAGKTDVIPGLRNTMWMQADQAGVYWGECAEYCGLQHTHMNLTVVAESPTAFRNWMAHQRQPSAGPTDSATAEGLNAFRRTGCAICHSIQGTDAQGRVGPDLTHLASRSRIAAGTLPNTPGNLAGWIANAQALKP